MLVQAPDRQPHPLAQGVEGRMTPACQALLTLAELARQVPAFTAGFHEVTHGQFKAVYSVSYRSRR